MNSFMSKFGGGSPNELPAALPVTTNALGSFLNKFTVEMQSYFFYNGTIELRFNVEEHIYYLVGELGELLERDGATTVLKKAIDRSAALTPWAAKMMFEKLLRTVPLVGDMLAPMSLVEFTKIALEAKGAHKEKLNEAGDIGSLAHKCLEDSIQYAIENTNGIVQELRNIPEDPKAMLCVAAGFSWMTAHNVRWKSTELKIYSREFEYAGTCDGEALVDSCDDHSCCSEEFKDSISVVDWKSSNALRLDYILQVAGAYEHALREEYGTVFQNCFVLRLGKNEEEAGKFEPWRIPAAEFPQAFEGFLTCLKLVRLIDKIETTISTRKKGVREAKKQMKAVQKELDKAAAKVRRAQEKAQLKLERTAEKERIKADAKRARDAGKNGVQPTEDQAALVAPTVSSGPADLPVAAPEPSNVRDNESAPSVKLVSVESSMGSVEEKVEYKPFAVETE
jgi:hypothetical protein